MMDQDRSLAADQEPAPVLSDGERPAPASDAAPAVAPRRPHQAWAQMLDLSDQDHECLRSFFRFFDGQRMSVNEEVRALAEGNPVVAGAAVVVEVSERSDLARAAFFDGEWQPYLDSLLERIGPLGEAGVSYSVWLDYVHLVRRVIIGRINRSGLGSGEQTDLVLGMARYLDLASLALAEARRLYVLEQDRNARQQAAVIESSVDAIFTTTLGGRITSWNPGAERLFGYTAAEAIGQNIIMIVPESHRQEVAPIADAVDRAERVDYFETVRQTKDGRLVDVSVSVSPVRDATGRARGAAIIARDMTERKRGEQRARQVLESWPTAFVLVNKAGTILLVNDETERLFGYSRPEMVGQPIEMLIPARLRDLHVRHREAFAENPETRRMGARQDLHGLNSRGQEFAIEVALNPFENADGSFVLAAVADVSARKQAEEMFRLAVEASPSGKVMVDARGTILLVNVQIERMFGYSRADLLGQPVEMLIPLRHRASHPAWRGGFADDAGVRAMGAGRELFGLRSDGTEFPVEVGLNPIQTAEGLRVLAAVVDVSSRRQAEAALRAAQESLVESEARARSIVENALDANVIMDSEGTVTGWNITATDIFGWSAEEALGRRLSELIIPHELREQHEVGLRRYLETGEGPLLNRRLEIMALHKHGVQFPVELAVTPIDRGGAIFFSAFISDVTERKQAEEMFRLAVESSPSGVVMVDAEGTILLVNAETERLFGYERRDLLGQPVDLLVPARFRSGHPGLREAFAADSTKRSMGVGRDLYGVRRDGSEFPIEVGLNPARTATGVRVLASVIDVTARKASEAEIARRTVELQRSNLELEQFAYVASHDLQEPLRMVASYTGLLSGQLEGQLDERTARYLGYVMDGATRMQRLIGDLLAYSRIGTRGGAFEFVEAGEVVEHVLRSLEVAIRESATEITVGPLPRVHADGTQLNQVFQNLIGNAIKFRREEPPRIQVLAQRDGQDWHFSVADNGIGIEREHADRIFQMFQRLHERGKYEGSGIGLAVAKRIVERHGGHIWFDSNAGDGSTFHFTIPVGAP